MTADMEVWKGRFVGDPAESPYWVEVRVFSFSQSKAIEAAEKFAEYAFYGMDMWDSGECFWENGNAVVVRSPSGEEFRFNINVRDVPEFEAVKIKET
jgi:hypothetical protein